MLEAIQRWSAISYHSRHDRRRHMQRFSPKLWTGIIYHIYIYISSFELHNWTFTVFKGFFSLLPLPPPDPFWTPYNLTKLVTVKLDSWRWWNRAVKCYTVTLVTGQVLGCQRVAESWSGYKDKLLQSLMVRGGGGGGYSFCNLLYRWCIWSVSSSVRFGLWFALI